MLPLFDTSPSREYPEPYRLLAPLLALSYPSGVALPQLRSDVPQRPSRELEATGRSDPRPH
jgi:hypothetical protein